MIINKDSWHYKVWKWTYWTSWEVPSSTNFCSYWRRVIALTPLEGLALGFIGTLYGLILLLPFAIVRWMFGYKTVNVDISAEPVEYSGLPLAGREIYPWHVIVPAALIGAEVFTQHKLGWTGFSIANAVLAGVAFLVALGIWFFCSETTEMFRDWVMTHKRKICPVIEFGDHYDGQVDDEEEDTCCDDEEEQTDDLLNKAGSGPEETIVAAPAAIESSTTSETK